MTLHRWFFPVACCLLPVAFLSAQSFAPPPTMQPDEETLQAIAAKTKELADAIEKARGFDAADDLIADVEVFHKAAVWIVKHGEWYHQDAAKWTLAALDQGLERAKELPKGRAPWLQRPGRTIRGYRSRIDGSIQPYGVVFPRDWGQDDGKRWRLDVVLHGRDTSLTEVKFIHQHQPGPVAQVAQPPVDQDFIQLNIYGRGNNAYRWAGERDVFEAVENFGGTIHMPGGVDTNRIVLRGFSMGGAGAWHLGLHFPSLWCSVSPGAGFSTTRGYVKNLPDKLPPYQEACLHLYDALDYAENAANLPFVAYGGEKDPQLQAARNIEAKLKGTGIPMTLIVGPDTEHRYHPDSLKEIMKLQAEHAAKGRQAYPIKVRFVSHTPKYHHCSWINLVAQERQYERSLVDAELIDPGFRVKTENVRILELWLPPGTRPGDRVPVDIDGQRVEPRAAAVPEMGVLIVVLERRAGRWETTVMSKVATDFTRRPGKYVELPGPIDDAFTGPFLCVRGTGKPWHEATGKYAEENLKRFQHEWSKYFRGELPVKADIAVTKRDFETKHLILFGDPASNSLIAQAVDRLPLEWTRDRLTLAGKTCSATDHVPVLIYPSPFNTRGYVVLNSGHTFHAAEFEGTNALLYPRLGDYALLRLAPTEKDPLGVEVVTAGLFDERWMVAR